ncbi:MAG TPA: bifunctional 5,10-methylene-tetrahydrofolate dehydrogenase/5,10-methylene-tetrahydrofolate cyclohydrolase [Clostridiales bacterium]|nr:bifunctional 5,10-methylene-tetrahydrofolate dehydrogenase/5,10-methylene-tetrahydrofolate cyclohydrolase [Clostridiales bacterium]HBR08758.1 bifunctional 5,10-methylene-tetrahydrofolate dehydrogenase/5,10-methylene-tetrahydrofolate cyclohydrolase [Clostridiales bacterium]
MAELLKGAPVAVALDKRTKSTAEALLREGVIPTLAILRVGERDDDMAYERGAMKRCAKLGIAVKNVLLPSDVSQDVLISGIEKLNADQNAHGVLILRPLPKTLDEKAACAALDPVKDVDGVTAASMAGIYSGSGDGFPPCTAQSCMELLKYYGVNPTGKRAVVIGRSLVIGKPVAMLLTSADATVTVCHTKTADMPSVARQADILIAAVGRAESIGPECFRTGQTVIDVGINWSEEKQKLVGDVNFDAALSVVSAITPVPAGVGSVTTAVLAAQVVKAAERTAL